MGSILRCPHPATEGVARHVCIIATKDKTMGSVSTQIDLVYIVLIALLRFSMNLIHQMHAGQGPMCGVIVVDAGRSRSTNLGREAYIHDHCLGYRHDHSLFYQLRNSNLFTHRMLFSREKSLVKWPPSLSFIILFSDLLFQKPKNTLLHFFIFVCVFTRSIYPISYNFIYLFIEEGLTTPLTH